MLAPKPKSANLDNYEETRILSSRLLLTMFRADADANVL